MYNAREVANMYALMKTRKKRKTRNVIDLRDVGGHEDFTIDEDDYKVLQSILRRHFQRLAYTQSDDYDPSDDFGSSDESEVVVLGADDDYDSEIDESNFGSLAQNMVDIRDEDNERRVHKLTLSDRNYEGISLPNSIGKLNKLVDLSIRDVLYKLPPTIGNLTSLTRLELIGSNISKLPSKIGRLRNLEELILRGNRNLFSLPEEVGALLSLNKLEIQGSCIDELPTSIGQLKNLKDLILVDNHELEILPEEIGNLVSLNRLELRNSKVAAIPPSVGKLQKLKDLVLAGNGKLKVLPKEIGKLASMNEELNLPSNIPIGK